MRNRLFALIAQKAVQQGAVTLASGQQSTIYIDCRQVYFGGEAQYLIGELFFQKLLELEQEQVAFIASGGMAMGSIPLSCALSAAAFRRQREFTGVVVRKETKSHGMMADIEGDKALLVGARVLLLEDVVSTAGSALLALECLRSHGMVVSSMLALVDREQGGRENLGAAGVELHALFKLSDFWEPSKHVDCHERMLSTGT